MFYLFYVIWFCCPYFIFSVQFDYLCSFYYRKICICICLLLRFLFQFLHFYFYNLVVLNNIFIISNSVFLLYFSLENGTTIPKRRPNKTVMLHKLFVILFLLRIRLSRRNHAADYIYIYICMCVCVNKNKRVLKMQ